MQSDRYQNGKSTGKFSELLKYTFAGYLGGLTLGLVLDALGLQRNAAGQWLVRTFCGEGESLFEGVYSLRARLAGRIPSMAEAYGWGKLIGIAVPWLIDWTSRAGGVDMYGAGSAYVPFFYAMGDQIGASLTGLLFLRQNTTSSVEAVKAYFRHPVMVASTVVIIVAAVGLLLLRMAGFSPTTQILTAIETIVFNLGWIPPLVGSLSERRKLR
jgi:hypothetical protein